MNSFISDVILFSGIIFAGFGLSILAYNMFEIAYWKYVDCKYGKDNERR
tara:strand:+ start:241 stop:387 length:147 start_codon:yes stop_codon:yes gene_type:complete